MAKTKCEKSGKTQLAYHRDYLAPDGSEIRLLAQAKGGGLAHVLLPVGETSKAVEHKTVEELWYFISGKGKVWRKYKNGDEEICKVRAGTSLVIPTGASFQFRNTGEEALHIVIATIPPWPEQYRRPPRRHSARNSDSRNVHDSAQGLRPPCRCWHGRTCN